jgi:peptide subunit release factor 1 (eRF1)
LQVTAPERDQLRRLAELRLDRPVVISLYLDLDPSEFGTPPARATAVRSLLDEAERRIRERENLAHEDKVALQATLQRASAFLERSLPTEGAQGVALFASEPAELFEAIKLPRPVKNRVAIGRSPLVGPLARFERRERWCIALVSRRNARIFRGSPDGVREIQQIHDTVFGQHDQGGLSQARFARGIEKEKDDHLKNTGEALLRHFKIRPFQRLLLGGPKEVVTDFEGKLHGYLKDRVAGHIGVDVDAATPESVLEAAGPVFDEVEREHEARMLERAGERGVAGIDAVVEALNERRVEVLLLDEQFSGVAGAQCLECGLLATAGSTCPADGAEMIQLEELTDAAIELAVQQSAEVLAVHHDREALDQHGGAVALLRF